MITVKRQSGIIQIHDNRITRLTENVSKTKYCIKHAKNCKEKNRCLNVAQQAKFKFCSKLKKALTSAGNVK